MARKKRRVALVDLAKELGVSPAAVSMALRNHPRVSRELAERAQQLASKRGYHTHPLVSTLMAEIRRGSVAESGLGIAFLHGWPGCDPMTGVSATYSAQLRGIKQRADDLGYRLEIHNAFAGENVADCAVLNRVLWSRGLQGVIVGPRPGNSRALHLDWSKLAAATTGYSLVFPHIHRAATDIASALEQGISYAVRAGAKRLGLVLRKDSSQRISHPWPAAWAVAALLHPHLTFLPLILLADKRPRSLMKWIRTHRPDAVFTEPAIVQEIDHKLSGRAPAWIDVTGDPQSGLPGHEQMAEILGAACVDLVVQQLQRNETGLPTHRKTVMVEPAWHPAASLEL